jgi:hypothetical protein
MSNATAIPYVLQDDFISVVLEGKTHLATKGQATFKQLYRALSRGDWARVPKLLTITSQLAERTHGKVEVTAEGVSYKGQKVDNTLTAKILELIEHGKPVSSWIRFMDNLYQQPDVNTVNRVYDWINSGRYAITTDGCIVGYKVVRPNYKDKHSGTVDNHIGARPLMARSEVDPSEFVECSRGYHVCTRGYIHGFYSTGDHIMVVKVNPADVVASPLNFGHRKFRCWTYEVIAEVLPHEIDNLVSDTEDAAIMMQPVIEVPNDRHDIIKKVKALPTVKRLMRRGKLTAASFSKASTERLIGWLRKFSRLDIAPSKSKLFENPLRFAREAAGLTLGQVRGAAGMTLQEVYNAERCLKPSQEVIDRILIAIAKLQGNNDIGQAGVSYPRPATVNSCTYYRTDSVASVDDTDEDEEEEWDEDDEF